MSCDGRFLNIFYDHLCLYANVCYLFKHRPKGIHNVLLCLCLWSNTVGCSLCCRSLGVDSFLMYSIHEGIRGISLDPNDNTEALMPITGTLFAVGVDFHAGMYHAAYIGIIYEIAPGDKLDTTHLVKELFCVELVHKKKSRLRFKVSDK